MKSKLLPVLVLVSVCGLLVGESAAFAEWKEVSRLLTRRRHHTATLLPSGKVLVIGGAFTGTSQPELFDPITGTWASIETSIEIAGSSHTATLLPSGLVLVVAGARAQLFDPVTGVLEETGPLNGSRSAHTATLLRSGKVLVAGGSVSPELYDPATQLWSELQWEPGQPAPSFQPGTATLLPRRFLPSGEVEEVLMVGGSSVEIYRYHPQTDTWTLRPAAPLQQTSFYHTATLLPSGNVLIVGEIAEIYTPTEPTGSRRLAQAPLVWNEHSATLLPSGKVLISGGSPGNGISTHRTELFDPQTETWTAVGSFPFEALSQTATLLATGGVLVAGGYNNVDPFFVLNFAAVFEEPARGWQDEVAPANFFTNPHILLLPSGKALVLGGDVGDYLFDESATGATRWTRIADSSFSRVATDRYTATLLRSGQVLVAGGSQAELFDPAAGGWTQTGPLRTARSGHTATILPSGKVLVAGGENGSAPLASAEIYDPQTGTWSETGSLAAARSYHAAILLASGEVLVAGGVEVTSAEIYDPATGQWTPAGSLREARDSARAVLLPSGKVLITGGSQPADQTAEIYDPATRSWELAAPPPRRLKEHTATLLPTGKILMAGGSDAQAEATLVVDIYDPLTGTWEDAPSLSVPRQEHGAVLLQTGKVLVLGGHGFGGDPGTGDLFDLYSLPAGRQRPEVTSVSPLRYGDSFVVEGVGFRGDSQATSGTRQSSAVDFPVIQLRSLDGRRLTWLAPQQLDFSDTRITAGVLPPGLDPGHLLLSVVVAGVPSEPVLAEVQCSLVITRQPGGQLADLGAAVTFEVESEGGEHYQWNRDGQPIPGATGASYTTGLLTAADAGSVYTVTVRSRCAEETSDPALLAISDSTPPQAAVVSPSGGEYWLLSTSETAKNREVVTWSMSDDIRICRVTVRLLFSIDGGATYGPVPGGPLLTAGPGGACRFGEQPEVSSLVYEIPTQPPGAPGALYKIEVEVTDFDTDPDSAGGARTTVARSPNPFFIVQSNPDAVRTLIVTHSARQESLFPGTRAALATGLQNLANHPRVQGIVVDLASVTGLGPLYDAWDLAPADPAKANDVLFASSGLHDYLREEIFPKFTGIRYLVLVGDDRIIPFGRVPDGTALSETTYVDSPGGDLSSQGTVGKALAAGLYLTDDLLAARRAKPPFSTRQIREGAFLPDLPAGRLVETPQEMIATIARFISKDGLLDLSALGEEGHKVLVTGYDFLIDSGQKIRQRWETALGQTEEGTAPVNGALLTAGWGQSSVEARRQALSQHLAGGGGPPYAVINLNGHATHYLEGVPGTGATDIQGLFSEDLPNVEGTVIYAVGCHGGLSVPGSASEDHPHDLPQAFLLRGALAYIANTGYGWGLEEGVGYGERIVELFTEEMTAGGTVVVGDAIRRAKLRYFLQVPSAVNGYDEKTLLQWTLFGLPMYAVRTGIGSPVAGATAGLLDPQGEASRVERLGRGAVERRPVAKASTLPRFLTQLNLHFDLSAEGVYSKLDALGRPVSAAGCPAPATGCYYTLNGVTGGGTGTTDLPIQPYFVYDSRLSGTSQHGALWTGGTYVEEGGWKPVIAKLASNGGDFSNHGSTPRMIKVVPLPHERPTGGGEACLPNDLDLNTLTVVTAELLEEGGGWVQRLYEDVDLEILYFNDQGRPERGNCDREGPTLGAPPFDEKYHRLNGSTVEWAVPASDEGGVWRVIVVYDTGPDDQGRGSWRPLELADDGSGVWRGTLPLPDAPQLTYFVQAVDRRGNVAWLDFAAADVPASGVPHDLPQPVEVHEPPSPAIASPAPGATFGVGDTITLAGSATDAEDGALPGQALSWTVVVRHGDHSHPLLGPVSGGTATFTAPAPDSLDAAATSYLEIRLTATDSRGLSATVTRDLQPARVELTFETEPAGLELVLDGVKHTAPKTVTSWRSHSFAVGAASQAGPGGETYVFFSWSDGGKAAHLISTPAAPATYTAAFRVSQADGPLDFYTVAPCRVVDTRDPAGPLGGPPLTCGQERLFALTERCGVPATARAVATNLTVVQPTAPGHLKLYPEDETGTATSTLNFAAGLNRANNAIVNLGTTGRVKALCAGPPGTLDLVVDVVGYFE